MKYSIAMAHSLHFRQYQHTEFPWNVLCKIKFQRTIAHDAWVILWSLDDMLWTNISSAKWMQVKVKTLPNIKKQNRSKLGSNTAWKLLRTASNSNQSSWSWLTFGCFMWVGGSMFLKPIINVRYKKQCSKLFYYSQTMSIKHTSGGKIMKSQKWKEIKKYIQFRKLPALPECLRRKSLIIS